MSMSRPTRRRIRVAALPALLVAVPLTVCAELAAQERSLVGVIVGAGASRAIAGAELRVVGTDRIAVSDSSGRFVWPGPTQGTWQTLVRAVGYQALSVWITVGSRGLVPDTLRLSETPQTLAPLTVEARTPSSIRLADFERRRQGGQGRFFTREQIVRTGAIRTSTLLRALPTGILVQDSLGTPLAVSNRGSKVVRDAGRLLVVPCVLRVAVDGHVLSAGVSIDSVDPNEVIGVEVYLGPSTIPMEFAAGRRDQFCGLVVLWTGRSAK